MENTQTAVEWLVSELTKPYGDKFINKIIEQAKEMEKQQIEKAWDEKCIEGSISFEIDNRTSEQYYNETYGK